MKKLLLSTAACALAAGIASSAAAYEAQIVRTK